jgi:hypothetical protein
MSDILSVALSGHPKPANEDHLKTGQRSMLGFVQSAVGRCWSSKGLPLRRSNSVLRQVATRSPHETTTNITKSLPASAR